MPTSQFSQSTWHAGIADSPSSGPAGSFAEIVGFNIHDEIGILKVSQAFKKISGVLTVQRCRASLKASDGNFYFFGQGGADKSEVYKVVPSTNAVTKVYTFTAAGNITNVIEYNGYIYMMCGANGNVIARKPFAGLADWSDTVEAWQSLADTFYSHPMLVHGPNLYLGDGVNIASVDSAGNFTLAGTPDVALISLPSNLRITTLSSFGVDISAGTRTVDGTSAAKICRWDTVSPAYTKIEDTAESYIRQAFTVENVLYYLCGDPFNNPKASLYYYDGVNIKIIKKPYGMEVVSSTTGCYYRGNTFFSTKMNGKYGLMYLGRYDRKYPLAMALEYVSANGSNTDNITTVTADDTNGIYMCSNTALGVYGIYAIDTANKCNASYFTTLVLDGNMERQKTYEDFCLNCRSLPANTSVISTYTTNTGASDTIPFAWFADYNKYNAQMNLDCQSIQITVVPMIDGNNAPEIEQVYCNWTERATL